MMEPPLLRLDEPLSNVDAKLRGEMRFELKRLQREIGITAVYVTHDQAEALGRSNVIAVMKDGVVQQVGRPREIYEHPRSRFVGDSIGTSSFIDGVVERAEGDDVYLVGTRTSSRSPTATFACAACNPSVSIPPGTDVKISFRQDACSLIAADD
jgi:ABC-type Fe3+/spermidine/putrescine transport system ATPase subunit